jgi:hypothetical protein
MRPNAGLASATHAADTDVAGCSSHICQTLAVFELRSHESYLALLGSHYFLGEFAHFWILAERDRNLGHVNCTLVMRYHGFKKISISIPE